MEHRHINTHSWTPAAIDSALERGNLPDWRELFDAVKTDAATARLVLMVASHHPHDGAFILASKLVEQFHPELCKPGQPAVANEAKP